MKNKILLQIKFYHKYYPSFIYSSISFVVLSAIITTFSFGEQIDNSDYAELLNVNLIEIQINKKTTKQEIKMSQKASETSNNVIEKKLEFGNPDDFENLISSGTPPKPRFYSLPEYPKSMRKAGIEGVVIIELGIDDFGNIKYGRIIKSLGKEFDITVINWAKKIRFKAALDSRNKPMKCKIQMPIRFELNS